MSTEIGASCPPACADVREPLPLGPRADNEERLLAQIGSLLLSAGTAHPSLAADVATMMLRHVADWCVVDIVQPGDSGDLKVLHVDPAKAAVCAALERHPAPPHGHGGPRVITAQRPLLVAEVSPAALASIAVDAEHLRLLCALEPASFVVAPLVARGQHFGVLVYGSTHARRRCGAADLRLAERLATLVALALDNARLHRELERAVQARDDLLGIVAHDLRNPLSAVLLAVRVLECQFPGDGADPIKARTAIASIRRSLRRASRLIEDLLDTTRIDAGHLLVACERVDPARLVADALEAHQGLAAASSLALHGAVQDRLPDIWADRDRCLQVLDNLIGNALKFTPPGGRITVGAAQAGDEVHLWVQDSGAGIAEGHLPHVFERFWQGRRFERRGAGLGLQICQGIVLAHGGRIWAESRLGQGTTLHFTLALAGAVDAASRRGVAQQ